MEEKILLGQGKELHEIPQAMWKQHLEQTPEHAQARLRFMTEAHHQVRYFVVKELANRQKPIEPETISKTLDMPLALVKDILEELERELFFLVRNEQGAITWAYPITVQPTPHRLKLNSGEQLYAA